MPLIRREARLVDRATMAALDTDADGVARDPYRVGVRIDSVRDGSRGAGARPVPFGGPRAAAAAARGPATGGSS